MKRQDSAQPTKTVVEQESVLFDGYDNKHKNYPWMNENAVTLLV